MVSDLLRLSRVWTQISLFVAIIVTGSQTWALGLGEIDLNSALNEKLSARIELLDAAGMQATEILVTLASSDDFEKVGVERFFYLTGLQFEVIVEGDRAWVSVTSRQPVSEPYLNFLVQVRWPNGRLLREYTLLLDPPTYGVAAVPSVSAPQQDAAVGRAAGRIERPAAAQTATSSRTTGTQIDLTPQTSQRATMPAGEGEFRMTDRNDTLWKIATTTLPSDRVNVQQQMLALQRLNPDAFIRNNINLLKAGYVLRVPTENDAIAMTRGDAALEVAEQNAAWRSPERVATAEVAPPTETSELRSQVDATDSSPTVAASEGEGQLRIVAGEGDSVVGSESLEAERQQAAALLEERDRLTREVDELTYQLDREVELSGSQLEVKDRQLEVKDQQIAELQAQLANAQTAAQTQQVQNQSTATPPEAEQWWQSTPVLGGAAAVLVLGLVGGLVTARRRKAEENFDDEHFDEADEFEHDAEPIVSEVDDETDEDLTLPLDELDDDADEFEDSEPEVEKPEYAATEEEHEVEAEEEVLTGSQTGDVIGEADIYIAYGRYPQAISLLLGVLEEDPGRNDVRLKLLECYVETMDRASFDMQMIEFADRCDNEEALATAREFESRLSESEIVPADSEATEPETASGGGDLDELEGVEEFDLSLDDAPTEEASPEEETSGPNAGSATSGLEFELELDEQPEVADDLGGDLGIDFDPDATPSESVESVDPVDSESASAESESAAVQTADPLPTEVEEGFSLEDLEVSEDEEETDFEFEEEGDSASTKLDLARAYIDMGDEDGARDILGEVLTEGSDTQQQQARELLEQL